MKIKLYNTLTRKKELFKPLNDKQVGIYTCGPTVYWYQHIGNLRTYISEDILKRALLYNGYKVKHVMNITDVGHLSSDADEGEDKMIKAIKREGLELSKESMLKIAKKYTDVFNGDLEKLNIIPPDVQPKATEHIPDQIKLIEKLRKNGYAYQISSGVYFDVSEFGDDYYGKFGRLSGLEDPLFDDQTKLQSRIGIDWEKKSQRDFALWITNQPNHIMQWDSPWGKGFPGWHIECSAMSSKYLGDQFDIHAGGEEHIPVHHTNEIAQSEAAFGKKPWVKYWMHNSWLIFKGEKMSKSKGEIYTVSALEEKGFSPLSFKYFCLNTHYKKQLNFTWISLKNAQNAYLRLKNIISELNNDGEINKKYLTDFEKNINDDLNTPKAVAVLWKMIRDKKSGGKIKTIEKMDEVFGLKLLEKRKTIIPGDIKKLLENRKKARRGKKWQEADEIRKELEKKGWMIKDTNKGTEITKIKN